IVCENTSRPKKPMPDIKNHDIYVRAHTARLDAKLRTSVQKNRDPNWPDYALVFDCETRLGAEQALTFGFWRFCELSNDEFVCLEEGILAADNGLSKAETAVLRNCYRTVRPQAVDNGADRLLLYSRAQFVKKVLAMAMQAN